MQKNRENSLVCLVLKIGWYLGKNSMDGTWDDHARKCLDQLLNADQLSFDNNPEFNAMFKSMITDEKWEKVENVR